DRPTTFVLRSGGSADRRLLHMNGAASDIVIRRHTAPAACATTTRDTPLTNFDVFARTWAEQYGFFDVRKADWAGIVARHRRKVTARTTPAELFQILEDMIAPSEAAHTSIRAGNIDRTFSGSRRSATFVDRADRPRAFGIVEQKYARTPLRAWCNGQLQYGR